MKTLDSKTLIEMIQDAGFKPTSYSGRGMFGEYCVGVSVGRDSYGNSDDLPRGNRVDSLGLGQIWYWPQCKWPVGLEEEVE